MAQHSLSPPALVFRWLVGIGLVSWRYLWSTTPLHRTESHEPLPQLPPPFPPGFPTERVQSWEAGVGSMFHRLFRVRVAGAHKGAMALMGTVTADLGRLVPTEVVRVHKGDASDRPLRQGDEIVVDMPGPWNGPVRVVAAEPGRLQLATLAGHLEAGQIEFRAYDADPHLVFEVETWARPATLMVHLLHSHLRLAKEIQLNMWVRFCLAAARAAGGKPAGGVEIRTTVTPALLRQDS